MSETETLSVRFGIATGAAGVRDQAKLAIGTTPNLAAHLQGLAAIDQFVIATSTRRFVGSALS